MIKLIGVFNTVREVGDATLNNAVRFERSIFGAFLKSKTC